MEPGRILALDVGDVRTGVAVSDPMRIIASPHVVLQEKPNETVVVQVQALVVELEPVCIVVGVPLDAHGGHGPQAEKTLAFVEALKAVVDVEIVLQDERYSTASAKRVLLSANMRRKKRKQVIDKIAATHILEAYMQGQAARDRQQEGRD
jgi:putative holliday junction resolvase